jgi:glycine cleavage system aminomethyltransferase T
MGRRAREGAGLACRAMATTHGQLAGPAIAAPTIGDRIRRAGAVMAVRDGHAVPAHFGSTATEMAVCVKRVGVAVRADLDVLEIVGPEPWLAHFLAQALHDDVPSPGRAVRVAGTWCCRAAPDRALVIAPWSTIARWTRCVREAIVSGSPISSSRRPDGMTALTLVGPRVQRLLADVALTPDIPIGAAHEARFTGAPALLVRETADRYLLVLDAERASDACGELFAAGASSGLSMVGTEALERLAARVSSLS